MSPFYCQVYSIVAKIPAGSVATYGQIALMAGKPYGARQVGYAMNVAPADLPCHRVVNKQGELAPGHIFGGKEVQRMTLEAEGIAFLPDGKIDLEKHLWDGRGL